MLQKRNGPVTPRGLVMSLFNAPDRATIAIGQLIKAGALFEIEASAIRMAVTRLIKDELISSSERGFYQAGEKAIKLNSEIQSWRSADKKIKPWNGNWLITLTSHLGRTNKTQLRSMARAFKLYGFVEIELGVWIRPANLVQGINQLRHNLAEIGMDKSAYLMSVDEVAGEHAKKWHLKWPIAELEASYSGMINDLETSLNSLKKMNKQEAAKESFMVGESGIHLINLDPLLPTEIIDTSLFKTVVAQMLAYDEIGQTHWQRFLSD